MTANRQFALGVVLLVFLTVLTYLAVLRNGFVYDDVPYVLQNRAVTSPSLRNVAWDTFPAGRRDTGLYRPVLTVSYIIDRVVADSPARHAAAAHAHNLVLHAAVATLLFLVLARLFPAPAAAFAAVVYAVHPVLSESVAWVTARSELLLGLWALAGTWCLLHPTLGLAARSALLAGAVSAALLSKESAVVLPAVWAAVSLVANGGLRRRDRLLLLGPALAVALVAVGIRVAVFGGLPPGVRAFSGMPAGTRYGVVFMSLWRYARMMVVPTALTVHWPPLPLAMHVPSAVLGVLVLCTCAVAAAAGILRRRLWALGPAWFLVMLFPYSNLAVPIGTIMAERFLYVPAMGLAFCLAWCLSKIGLTSVPARRIFVSVAVVCVALLSAGTRTRARVWRDDLTLWRAAARAYPGDLVARVAEVFYLVKRETPGAMAEASRAWQGVRRELGRYPGLRLPRSLTERIAWIEWRLGAGPP